VVVAAFAWFRPAVKPRLVEHQAQYVREQLFSYDLRPYQSTCDPAASREALLERVLAPTPEVSAVDLACVARLQDGSLLAPYFERVVLTDPDKARQQRHFRGGVALLVALGDPAVDGLCDALGNERAEVRSLAARALAESSSPRARTCLGAGTLHPRPEVRGAVAEALPTALARGQVEPGPGWVMMTRLLGDADPMVRRKAAEVLYLFNAEVARPAAERLQADADPTVAEAGSRAVTAVEIGYRQEQLFGKR
jgi:HEAT repeat protein